MLGNAFRRSIEASPIRAALTHGLAFSAVVVPLAAVTANALHHTFAFDAHYAFLPAARAVVHGGSPYSRVTSQSVKAGIAYLYPPLGAYLFAPFTLLPSLAADVVATVVVAATVPATLLLLDVRDWRCHAFAFLWLPTINGIQTTNVTLPMVLGLAVVWRYRDRLAVAGPLAGLLIALKLLFWPVLVWLLVTRRYRSAALGAAASVALVLVPWAGIGFASLHEYPHLLSYVAHHEGPDSYSVAALLHFAIPSWTASVAFETAIGIGVLALVVVAAHRGHDREAYALTVLGILVLTPLLEMHYFAALIIVVALYRRRLSAAWVVPLLMWGAPPPNNGSGLQRIHLFLVAAAIVVIAMNNWRSQLLPQALRSKAS